MNFLLSLERRRQQNRMRIESRSRVNADLESGMRIQYVFQSIGQKATIPSRTVGQCATSRLRIEGRRNGSSDRQKQTLPKNQKSDKRMKDVKRRSDSGSQSADTRFKRQRTDDERDVRESEGRGVERRELAWT